MCTIHLQCAILGPRELCIRGDVHLDNQATVVLTAMEIAFAHAIAFGRPMSRALLESGYASTSAALGRSILIKPEVQAIIAKDREWLRDKQQASKEALAAQLDSDREFAYTLDQPGAAVAATMGKAKIYGFMDPGATGRIPTKITISWGDESSETIHETGSIVAEENLDD